MDTAAIKNQLLAIIMNIYAWLKAMLPPELRSPANVPVDPSRQAIAVKGTKYQAHNYASPQDRQGKKGRNKQTDYFTYQVQEGSID